MPIMGATEEPILSRLDRLDNMLKYLNDIKGLDRSPRSSCESTPSSGTLTSEGRGSSLDFSQKSLENHCRPIEAAITQAEVRGTLTERLDQLECRVLKLCLQLEKELEAEKKREEKRLHKKGLKPLVELCIKRGKVCIGH
ncbi:uncharacterized protein LOC120011871 isoform X1 [Tripterygium wilfordii]|uniref:uncharacterized protein LOC120011871 isoform X1 n=1 Tax=Tripterygium wilfordii TaxID=458696 RepID=UPI0018F84E5B|nr:uncharacterized protein LOC120011871 isoform X1 [Tripterygium wilfordii]